MPKIEQRDSKTTNNRYKYKFFHFLQAIRRRRSMMDRHCAAAAAVIGAVVWTLLYRRHCVVKRLMTAIGVLSWSHVDWPIFENRRNSSQDDSRFEIDNNNNFMTTTPKTTKFFRLEQRHSTPTSKARTWKRKQFACHIAVRLFNYATIFTVYLQKSFCENQATTTTTSSRSNRIESWWRKVSLLLSSPLRTKSKII